MKRKSLKLKSTLIVFLIIFSPLTVKAEIDPQEIIEKSIDAQGGREALEKVKDTATFASFKVYLPQGEYLGERKIYSKSDPLKIRIEQNLLGMQTIIGFDGQIAWLEQMGKAMTAPQSVTDSFKASIKREDLLLKYKEKECRVEYLGQSEVENQPCHKIKFTDKEKNETTYYIDLKTYLPIKTEFYGPDETGKMVKNEVVNSNFSQIENLMMPFKTTVYVDGKKSLELTAKEIKINQGLDDNLFSMPEKK